jgi:hypothetical protein
VTISIKELQAQFEAELGKMRVERAEQGSVGLDPEQAAALAVLPRWDAEAAGALDIDVGEIETLLELGTVTPSGSVPVAQYACTPTWRQGILAASFQDATVNVNDVLRSTAQRIAGKTALPALQRWVVLAGAGDGEQMATVLDDIVDKLAHAPTPGQAPGSTSDYYLDEILGWLEVARPLAELMRGQRDFALDLAIARAGRQIELLRRDARDAETLRGRYVIQPELDGAFEALLATDDASGWWCLHYAGNGGAGKTMLIRHLGADLARPRKIPFARIDFDHLSPDFPLRNPGLLYWSFLTDLGAYAGNETARTIDVVRKALDKLNLELTRSGGDPLAHSLFIETTHRVADVMRQIAGDRPLVLVLDTTEELANYQGDGQPSRGLLHTFSILETLKAHVPRLRVVFAGRRPLAGGRLPERPYLRVCQVNGFTEPQVREFLTRLAVEDRFVAPILAATGHGGYHLPFEVSVLADWTRQAPAPEVDEVRNATANRYVELRILRRLGDDALRRAMPMVTILGHFDEALLKAALPAHDRNEVLRLLPEQEWIAPPIQGGTWRSVEERMLRGFESHFAGRLPAWDERAGARDHIDGRLFDGELDLALDWHLIDVALRLRMDRPIAEVWEWWRKLEDRMVEVADLTWTGDRLLKLLDHGVAARPGGESVRLVLLAANACLGNEVRHVLETFDDVAELPPAMHARLEVGQFGWMLRDQPWMLERVRRQIPGDGTFDRITRFALRRALLDYVTDHLDGDTRKTPWRELRFADGIDDDPEARLLSAIGEYVWLRLCALAGELENDPTPRLLAAVDRIPNNYPPPPNPDFRIRDLRAAFLADLGKWVMSWGGDVLTWHVRASRELVGDPLVDLPESDAQRALGACVIQAQLAGGDRSLRARAGRIPPPSSSRPFDVDLEVSRAMVLASIGELERALALLEAPGVDGYEPARAYTQVVRTFRLWDAGLRVPELLRESPDPRDGALVAAVDALRGRESADMPLPSPRNLAAWTHVCWRSLRVYTTEEKRRVLEWAGEHLDKLIPTEHPLDAVALDIDRTERDFLERSLMRSTPSVPPRLPLSRASEWLAVALRARAFGVDAWSPFVDELAARLGLRRAAEIALDEAELMALRLAPHAVRVFMDAEIWFARIGDDLGRLRTLVARCLILGDLEPVAAVAQMPLDQILGLPRNVMAPLRVRVEAASGRTLAPILDPSQYLHAFWGDAEIHASLRGLAARASPSESRPRVVLRVHGSTEGYRSYRLPTRAISRVDNVSADHVVDAPAEQSYASLEPPSNDALANCTKSIELLVQSKLYGPCWEAWIWRSQNRPPRLRRVAAKTRPRTTPTPPWVSAHVAASNVADWLRSPDTWVTDWINVPELLEQRHSVVYLAGLAREEASTFDATRWHLVDPFRTSFEQSVESNELPAPSTTASQLARLASDALLYIVHVAPWLSGTPPRTDTTRLDAITTRRFAGELAESGAAVIVIPPLEPKASLEAARRLNMRLTTGVDNSEHLVEVVEELRTFIESVADVETALDVCLYAPADWRAPVRGTP